MALRESSTSNLERVVTDGMHRLLDEVNTIRNRGKHPLLIAVSRRMPHVLFWFKHTRASKEEREILDEIEIVTEIALPFIQFHSEGKEYEVIVVDDVVYSGKTLSYIVELTKDIAGIDAPKVLVFFYYDDIDNIFEYRHHSDVIAISRYYENDHENIRNFISTIMAVTLPIDVSYPLFYIEDPIDCDLDVIGLSWFRDKDASVLDNYLLEIPYKSDLNIGQYGVARKGERKVSYTSLLQSELSNSLNNDFAKIRVYDRLGEIVLMSYAPNIIADFSLRDSELFECKEYNRIWNIALSMVSEELFDSGFPFEEEALKKERRSNRTCRSLVSVANYLYSVSSFNRILKGDTTANSLEYKIKEEDVSLIVGRELAQKILPLLHVILVRHLVSPKAHRKLAVEPVFIPDDYYTEYTVSKYTSIDDGLNQLDSNLQAIFQNAREKSEDFLALTADEVEYGVEGIMESFESIEKTLLVKDYKRKVEINKWVDRKIDEGELVSRYAYTYDFSGNRYWRRFFRKTSL